MGGATSGRAGQGSDIDAVLRASRVFVAVVARSMAEVEDLVTTPQWRVLVLVATRGPQTLGAVASDLGVHASSATRTCDHLETAGLIRREKAQGDRRFVSLQLTYKGRSLMDQVMSHRQHALQDIVERMSTDERQMLITSLTAFAEAAGEVSDEAMTTALGIG